MADMTLRDQHPRLHYRSYRYDLNDQGLTLEWDYFLEPNLNFTTKTLLHGVGETQLSRIPKEVLDWYAFHLGLVESFSYWKLAIPSEIVIEAGFLSSPQEKWWHDLLIQGMGEFFYVNDIDFTPESFVRFANAEKIDQSSNNSVNTIKVNQNDKRDIKILSNTKILVPIGGGKDSVVTVDLLQKNGWTGDRAAVLQLHPTQAAIDVSNTSGLPQVKVERWLDPQMVDLNQQGYLNGHTPFSAMLAFLTNFTALLWGYDYVAVSNERSSNEGNVMFHGQEINHQYSKTYEFETKFRDYLKNYGPQDAPQYFSFVRPLYELQIAQLFAPMKQYHAIFRSCNVGSKTNTWCGHCAKCLFAYMILSAVMPLAEVEAIFGQDLWANLELKQIALEQLGYAAQKPLDCVGTHEESRVASLMAVKKYHEAERPLPALLEQLYKEHLQAEPHMETRQSEVLTAWNGEHHLPPELETLLQSALKAAQHAST